MNRVILGRRSTTADDLIHHNGGLTKRATYFIGGYKAGLKPWQQFLLNGSPGFEPEPKDLVYPEDVRKVGDRLVERHVPMGALALVQRHTARARALAAEHAQTDEVDDEANFMADFDNHVNTILYTRHAPLTYANCSVGPQDRRSQYIHIHDRPPDPSPAYVPKPFLPQRTPPLARLDRS